MKTARDLVLVLFVLALSAGPAFARQLDAQKAPTVTGPLTGGEPSCDEAEAIDEDTEEVVAMVKLCVRLYALDPGAEQDEANDYGVLWLQSNVDASPGWCANEVNTSALIGAGGAVTQYSPAIRLSPAKKEEITVRLKVDAEGNATENARLAQELLLFPRRFTMAVAPTEEGTMVRGQWKGSAGRKLAFATATEISFPAGVGSPEMNPELTYSFTKNDRC